jgi:ERCC4-related helicase
MLSSRAALSKTVENRLSAIGSRAQPEEPPTRAELRELQADLPLRESAHERIASRIVRASISKETKRRNAERKQLQEIQDLIRKVEGVPDPKISALISDLEREVFSLRSEKAIIFTEYLDTIAAIREALQAKPELKDSFAELTGGLSAK